MIYGIDERFSKPFVRALGVPLILALTITYLAPYLGSGGGEYLDGVVQRNANQFPFSILYEDASFSGYPREKFLVHELTIFLVGPLLAINSALNWSGFYFLIPLNRVGEKTSALTQAIAWCFVAAGVILATFYNDHKSGFCGGCEYKSEIFFPLVRYMGFVVLGWAVSQVINSIRFVRRK